MSRGPDPCYVFAMQLFSVEGNTPIIRYDPALLGNAPVLAATFAHELAHLLLATMDDIRPMLEGRPILDHARKVAPGYPGHVNRVFPQDWLQA